MNWRRETWAYRGPLVAIVAIGAVLRSWGLTWGLYNANVSRRPHPDEWPVYWLMRWFGATHSLNPCPSPPGQCFLDWGTVFPYAAYLLHAPLVPLLSVVPRSFYGPRADPQFVQAALTGRLVSVIASTATIVVAYYLGREAYSRQAGLAAALVVALSGLLIQLAHFGTPDSTTMFLMSCCLLAALRAVQIRGSRPLLVAGVLAGAAMGTEYHMVLLAGPILAAWLVSHGESRTLLLAMAAMAGTCLLLNIYDLVDFPAFLAATEHTLRIRTVDSGLEYGDQWSQYGPAWLYVIRFALGFGVGFALAAWLLAGVGWAALRRTKTEIVLLSWVAPYFLLATLSPAKFMRYSAPLLVPLAVLAAGFAVHVLTSIPRARALLALMAAATVAYSTIYDAAYAGLFASVDPRTVAASWLNAHVPAQTRLAFAQLPNGLINMPYFLPTGQYQSCFDQFQAARLDTSRYVVVDSYEREEHPRTLPSQVRSFQNALTAPARFRVVRNIHYVPTFLGLKFPIDGSPHDWRYPTHGITIYQSHNAAHSPAPYCFPTVKAATKALYVSGNAIPVALQDRP